MKKNIYAGLIFFTVLVTLLLAAVKFHPAVKAAFSPLEGKERLIKQVSGTAQDKKTFEVYYYTTFQKNFSTFGAALSFAKKQQHASIRKNDDDNILWDNYSSYTVYQEKTFRGDFKTFAEAVDYAKNNANASVYYKENNNPVWAKEKTDRKKFLLQAPLLSQLPELPRGCEVTSLAMLLQNAGINADKMVLAKQLKKDPPVYQKKNGTIFFGNPYDGFVGNMYTFTKPGYGVYHGPIKELAERYLPNQIVDMTGTTFEDLFFPLQKGRPVWVIANTAFTQLPERLFEHWNTLSGPVKITYKEHSVLLTGYDQTYVYSNDPLANVKNRKIPIVNFKKAWEQMGKQAITYVPS